VSEHRHEFELISHIDSCHYYESVYRRACGTTINTFDERDFIEGSLMWAEPGCQRCEELEAGAKPRSERVVWEMKP
jgi:hypothetical protein